MTEWTPERVVVSVSGGKDSTATLALALETVQSGIEIIPVFADTKFEHPAVYEYLDYLDEKLGVKIVRVDSKYYPSMDALIRKRGIFPSHARRFCTDELKQRPINRWLKTLPRKMTEHWLGMRSDESSQRGRLYGGLTGYDLFLPSEVSKRNHPKNADEWLRCRLPIVEWTLADVWAYLAKRGIEPNPLYSQGHDRVGCFPCLLGGTKNIVQAMRDPHGMATMQRMFALEDELNEKTEATSPRDGQPWQERPVKIKPKADRFELMRLYEASLAGDPLAGVDNTDGGCAVCKI